MLSCPVGRAEDEEAAPLDASTALSMSDRIMVSSPIGGRLIAELSMSGFAGLFASLGLFVVALGAGATRMDGSCRWLLSGKLPGTNTGAVRCRARGLVTGGASPLLLLTA